MFLAPFALLVQTLRYQCKSFCPFLDAARTLLQHCSGHKEYPTDLQPSDKSEIQCINILVTSGSLIPSLVKCMLFRLDSLMTCENGLFSFLSPFQSLISWYLYVVIVVYGPPNFDLTVLLLLLYLSWDFLLVMQQLLSCSFCMVYWESEELYRTLTSWNKTFLCRDE